MSLICTLQGIKLKKYYILCTCYFHVLTSNFENITSHVFHTCNSQPNISVLIEIYSNLLKCPVQFFGCNLLILLMIYRLLHVMKSGQQVAHK